MAPALVQASTGNVVTTGTSTVSLTNCTEGNLVFLVWVEDGGSNDSDIGNHQNIETLAGGANDSTFFQTVGLGSSNGFLKSFVGRVMANGTVSADFTVGASGADLFVVIYEFSGASKALGITVPNGITEDTQAEYYNYDNGTGTTITIPSLRGTKLNELAVAFIGVTAQQALAAATGESGGDWTEPVQEFASASGTAATLGIQIAEMASPGTISGGTITISSNPWGVLGFVLKPESNIPVFVGAGTAVEIATGTATVSKTGCIADNLLLFHFLVRGSTGDFIDSNGVNIKKQDGTLNDYSMVFSNGGVGTANRHTMFICRVTANGTCSIDFTVGASGEDILARIYEFSDVALGANQGANTLENDTGTEDHGGADGQTMLNDNAVITNGNQRLACNFIALDTNQTPGAMTGMTGGTWTVATTAPTATGTLQLQTAEIASAGTIDGGSVSVSSTDIGVCGLALIPASTGPNLDTILPDADITTTGWSTAPLYSKLNDGSDSTVIQATAS